MRNHHAELESHLASNISRFISSLPPSRDSSKSNLEMANIEYNTVIEESRKIKMDE